MPQGYSPLRQQEERERPSCWKIVRKGALFGFQAGAIIGACMGLIYSTRHVGTRNKLMEIGKMTMQVAVFVGVGTGLLTTFRC